MDVEIIGDSPGDIEERLAEVNLQARRRTNQALKEQAEETKTKLERTSPVDTGEYKSSWYIWSAKEDEVWILNEADHAKYVMLPNSKFIGLAKADLPASGVLHNVKGIARAENQSLRENLSDQIADMLKAVSSKNK